MRIHILGICGTFMGGLAAIAKAAGHEVSGSDENVYPPMSEQLSDLGIHLQEGYNSVFVSKGVDCVVVGNGLSRGNVAVEALLNSDLPYYSGPQWLFENVLQDKWVLAVAGTHGKTTTSSMLAWILEYAQCSPGFLIGGVPHNFGISARLGEAEFFVIEADEYDTAFFDKRAKFVHYRPSTLSITNIEYDHADIYTDLNSILWQFHQLLRTIPSNGRVHVNGHDKNIEKLLEQGVWSPIETFGTESGTNWCASYGAQGAESHFNVYREGIKIGETAWNLFGKHNLENALAALSAAVHAGVSVETGLEALSQFKGVKRRLEKRGTYDEITLYDDFAHHPTAITATTCALRDQHIGSRIVIVIEPKSNTMKMNIHGDLLLKALAQGDRIFLLASDDLEWNPESVLASLGSSLSVSWDVDSMLEMLLEDLQSGDCVVMMSNGGFQGLRDRLQEALKSQI
jgi:UDP-N-acetylmuramate: L-alanyl-gamma-D-glutamyl-meso-diaminopimelate ligase